MDRILSPFFSISLLHSKFLMIPVRIPNLAIIPDRVRAPVNHDVGRELVPADMADEVDAHAAGPRVVHVAVEAQRAEVAFELAFEQGRRLPAAGVAGALGAHEDEVFVRAGARLEGRGGRVL